MNGAEPRGSGRLGGPALFFLTVTLCVLLIGYGFRNVLAAPSRSVPGCELDTINFVWGIWWSYAQTISPDGLFGVDHFNLYPVGVKGMILAPLSAVVVWPFLWWKGVMFAYNITWVFNLGLIAGGVAFLTRRISGSWKAAGVAAIAVLASRPAFANLSMGQLHGVTSGWFALGAGLWWMCSSHWRAFLGGLMMSIALVESPYAVVPVALACLVFGGYGLIRILRNWREIRTWGVRLVLAAAGVLILALPYSRFLVSSSAAVEPVSVTRGTIGLAAKQVPIFDQPSLHFRWTDVFNPLSRPFSSGEARRTLASGGRSYLGCLAILLGLLLPSSRRWMLVAILGVLMADGSLIQVGHYQVQGPFAYVNYLLSRVLAPLTMPNLLLVYAAMATAVAAGIGATRVAGGSLRVWAVLMCAIAADGIFFGGPSMSVRAISADGGFCVARVIQAHPGAVHLVDHAHCIARLVLSDDPPSLPAAETGADAHSRHPAGAVPGDIVVGALPAEPGKPEGPDALPGSSVAHPGESEVCPAKRKMGQLLQAIHGQPYTDVSVVRRWKPLGAVPKDIADLSAPLGPLCLWYSGRQVDRWEWTAPVEWIIVSDPEKKLDGGPLGKPVARCDDFLVYRKPYSQRAASNGE